jgi:hypothetical protein
MGVNFVPSIVPNGHDQIIYLVINNYGKSGTAFPETDVDKADLETVISDLMSGQYSGPVRVIGFNTPNIGLRMPRRMSRGKLCAVSISPARSCPHRSRRSSTSTSVRTGN